MGQLTYGISTPSSATSRPRRILLDSPIEWHDFEEYKQNDARNWPLENERPLEAWLLRRRIARKLLSSDSSRSVSTPRINRHPPHHRNHLLRSLHFRPSSRINFSDACYRFQSTFVIYTTIHFVFYSVRLAPSYRKRK